MPQSHHQSSDNTHHGLLPSILLVLLACFILAGMDGLGKHLMAELSTHQVVWARYSFHALLVGLVFGMRHGPGFLRSRRPGLQALRGAALLGVTYGIYLAIHQTSLADATAILFLAPVLVTLLAGPLLGEQVRAWHWLGALVGFVGVLVIIRPEGELQTALLWPLGSALLLALYLIMTRLLKGQDSERTTLFHTTLTGSLVLSLLLPLSWHTPTAAQWLLLILMGVLGASGHLLLIRAFHLAPASLLSPFLNGQIIAAAFYSWLFFEDTLGVGFLVGAALIAGAGLMVWYLDRRLRQA